MARILVVSDIHGSLAGFHSIREMISIHSPELLVICGDITNFGRTEWQGNILDRFDIPIMAVNGNCDTMDVAGALITDMERGLINRTRAFGELNFLGLGYPIERDIDAGGGFDALITHVPPKGCNDRIPGGNRGDEWLRKFVMERRPRLVLSGHIHESRGICRLGETVCVNPGPAMDGLGAIIQTNHEIRAELVNVDIPAKL
ncbi:MAG: metallophosphoesterase family protein [Thermoplasmata archaeon]